MNITPKGHERRELIARLAALPEGFNLRMCNKQSTKSCAKIVGDEFLDGKLYRVKTSSRWIWYFANREHAEAFAGPGGVVESHPLRLDADLKPTAKPAPKVSSMARKPLSNISRKPYVPPVRTKAVIVWPEGVKHTIIPTPVPRNFVVSHSFVHSGMRAMA